MNNFFKNIYMIKLKTIPILLITLITLIGCKNSSEKTTSIKGNYVSSDYEKRNEGYDWVAVSVSKTTNDEIQISVRSRSDKKEPTCSLNTKAKKEKEGVYKSVINNKGVLFTFKDNQILISAEDEKDKNILYYFCSGGASLGGTYHKINGNLDATQTK